MNFKIKDISEIINGRLEGNPDYIITRISSPENSDENSVVFVYDIEKLKNLNFKAGCAVINENLKDKINSDNFIYVDNPRIAFIKLLNYIDNEKKSKYRPGVISNNSFTGKNCVISEKAHISESVFIGDNVRIEDGVIIEYGCYIGDNVKVGKNTRIYPGVIIREDTEIGANCIIHSGSVIGSDGFGYIQHEGKHIKIPQIGKVIIGDDVEIGANVTIDRATVDATIIGSGTKIDNLVHIAHNVKIGKNCLLIAQCGIAGSTVIGNNVIIAGQAGLADHIVIEDNAIIMAQSGVIGNIKKGEIVFGTPARDRNKFMRVQAILYKLPEIYKYYLKKIKNEG